VIDCGVAILGGGAATRFPGKLEAVLGDVPLIVRVYRNLGTTRTTYISCNTTFAPEVDALLPVPMVVDRFPGRGPLAGLLATMHEMPTPLVFAVAGDAPYIGEALLERLLAAYRPGDEAVVPIHHGTEIEPLAAVYDRSAFLRAGTIALRDGDASLRAVIAALRTRFVAIPPAAAACFANVNTPADFDRLTREFETA
jgi:molybdopterin-guanine dinucleotide biosynthesis protein A